MKTTTPEIYRHRFSISVICTFFITYPNVMWIPWNINDLAPEETTQFWTTFVFRCLFFLAMFYYQIGLNSGPLSANRFIIRFAKNILFTAIAGTLFISLSCLVPVLGIQSGTVGKHLTFQFLVVCMLCTFIGHITELNISRSRRETEIERLRMENLRSRYNALVSQINPHFFFNSLNSISTLVQRGNEDMTLEYINRLSDIFRYLLRNDAGKLVPVSQEIEFVNSFAYIMETRFGGKLKFRINIPECCLNERIPILSFLPLLENVSVHNRIDSTHRMNVLIGVEDSSITVENDIYPKLTPTESNGTGLRNLNNRYILMTGQPIRIEQSDNTFKVYLPFSHNTSDESPDC